MIVAPSSLARALVAIHGDVGAIALAERSAAEARRLGLAKRAKEWEEIIEATRGLKQGHPIPANDRESAG